jgi:hypothetical protein
LVEGHVEHGDEAAIGSATQESGESHEDDHSAAGFPNESGEEHSSVSSVQSSVISIQ